MRVGFTEKHSCVRVGQFIKLTTLVILFQDLINSVCRVVVTVFKNMVKLLDFMEKLVTFEFKIVTYNCKLLQIFCL